MRARTLATLTLAALAAGSLTLARAEGEKKKIGLVFDIGGKGDKSFNDAANRGLERAQKELPVDTECKEPGEGNARAGEMQRFASRKFDLVFGVGFMFTDDI